METKPNKIMVIALDGATFDIIQPMIDRGELPNLSKLMSEGTYDKLLSTIPPETGPAFVTFMTGTNPGRHGITRFVRKSVNQENAEVLNSSHIASKTIWELLSEHGKKLIVLNIPFTFPPIPINGAMVSFKNGMQTYPPDLKERLIDQANKNNIKIKKGAEDRISSLGEKDRYESLLNNTLGNVESVKQALLFLMREYDWDFVAAYFHFIDHMQHHFWKFMDTEHPLHDPESPLRFKEAIFNAYRKADEIIGEILKEAGEDVTTLIMSDHGSAPITRKFHINRWLEEKGFLKFNNGSYYKWRWERIPITILLRKLLNMMGLSRVSSWISWMPVRIPICRRRLKPFYELINWEETRAYGDFYGININLKGRETFGIVSSTQEYDSLVKELIDKFNHLTDTEKTQKIVERIFRKEDIYTGPMINEGTDVIPLLQRGYYIDPDVNIKNDSIFDRIPPIFPSGHHTHNLHSQKGILIMKGNAINSNSGLKEPGIIDLAPTILYLMGLPIPKEMEGRVLCEAIRPEYLETHPLSINESGSGHIDRQKVKFSAEEAEAIKNELRKLGYL